MPAEESSARVIAPPLQPWSRWLRGAIYSACGVAFTVDLASDSTLAFGVFYIPLVGTAVYYRETRAVWWLAILATVMVAIGYFFPVINPDVVNGLTNRGLSIAAIFATACLIRYERQIRDRLIEQTRRAETADRAKTQLFTHLSHELRTPLSAILGFAELLIRDARSDQRAALGHVQSSGKRLLATVDNLLDLVQLEGRTLRVRSIDIMPILRQVMEANRAIAVGKDVELTFANAGINLPSVNADSWAVNRIIDNLISNGIKFTEQGGSVAVSADAGSSGVTIAVKDTGAGMSPDVLQHIGEPFFQAESGTTRRFEGMGTGLALSTRLASMTGAKLTFDSIPGTGSTATLTLTIAERSRR